MQVISESSNTQDGMTYIPTLIMNQKAVRNKLAISYAKDIVILLISSFTMHVRDNVCKLPRRKRIDLFTEMALLLVNVNSSCYIQQKKDIRRSTIVSSKEDVDAQTENVYFQFVNIVDNNNEHVKYFLSLPVNRGDDIFTPMSPKLSIRW